MTDGGDLHALVLAGSRQGEADPVARHAGVSCKAFTPAAGEPMIERVLGVLLDYPRISRIDVSLPLQTAVDTEAPRLAEWSARHRVRLREPASSPAGTVADALQQCPDDASMLVTTADHVLLSAAILDEFLNGCDRLNADVCAGFLPLDVLESRYPGMKRTGLRLRGGRYSGCNLFLMRNGRRTRSLVSFWRGLEARRKSPWGMALAVGPAALVGYGLRLLTLPQALKWIGGRAGAVLAPVVLDIPEAAIDVDTPQHLVFVENLLESRNRGVPV